MASERPKKYVPRIPPKLLGGFVLLLLTSLVLLQSSNIWKRFEIESAGDTLILYGLSSLNFFAFVIFAFIFIRSLLKLSRERRALEIGSQIKSRLVKYFFAISVLPIVAMTVFSYGFMNRAMERWFTQMPENVIRQAQLMQNQAAENQTSKLEEMARMLVETLEKRDVNNETLARLVERGNLTKLEILSPGNEVSAAAGKTLDARRTAELERTLELVRQNKFADASLSDGQGFDAANALFSDGRRLVVVPEMRTESNINQMGEKALAELDRLKDRQLTVRQIGFSTLGLLTFLLIFAASWTALHVARGLTAPIKALAEGSDEIARGNFAYRVDAFAEDELALLVSAFNQMAARLEASSDELRERRKYTETVLQSLSTGVISFDATGSVTTINKAAVQMLKLENRDFRGLALSDLVKQENLAILKKLLMRASRIGQAAEQTVLIRETGDGANREAGENLPVALTATALPKTSGGATSGTVLVIEDLSELLNAQRASAWQEVARRMAHEIKNPLTPIQLSAERIAKRFAARLNSPQSAIQSSRLKVQGQPKGNYDSQNADGKLNTEDQLAKVVDESTRTILREVDSLKLMVDEFSRFARLPNVKLENGNVNDVVAKSIAVYDDRLDGVSLDERLAKNLPNAMIDEEQLRRVFINLIENAVEAFDTEQTEKSLVIRTAHDEKRDLIICEIADNGAGIAFADFQKLFQPYFSTKGRGTGLGLAIVQRIVHEHGGKIRAVSNVPKGAKFIVELPTTNA